MEMESNYEDRERGNCPEYLNYWKKLVFLQQSTVARWPSLRRFISKGGLLKYQRLSCYGPNVTETQDSGLKKKSG